MTFYLVFFFLSLGAITVKWTTPDPCLDGTNVLMIPSISAEIIRTDPTKN